MPNMDGGLELLTSDGNLAAQLQRAVRGLQIQFSLRVRGELSPEQLEGVMEGELDSGQRLRIETCAPTGGEGSNRWYGVETVGANARSSDCWWSVRVRRSAAYCARDWVA